MSRRERVEFMVSTRELPCERERENVLVGFHAFVSEKKMEDPATCQHLSGAVESTRARFGR